MKPFFLFVSIFLLFPHIYLLLLLFSHSSLSLSSPISSPCLSLPPFSSFFLLHYYPFIFIICFLFFFFFSFFIIIIFFLFFFFSFFIIIFFFFFFSFFSVNSPPYIDFQCRCTCRSVRTQELSLCRSSASGSLRI